MEVALYAGVDPKAAAAAAAAAAGHTLPLNLSWAVNNVMSPVTLIMGSFVWLKVAAKKRKLDAVPVPVPVASVMRDPATGLPPVPLAPLAMDLGRVVLMVILLICVVLVPELLVAEAMEEPGAVLESPVFSFIVAFVFLFNYFFVVLIVVPTAIFASNPMLRSFTIKNVTKIF